MRRPLTRWAASALGLGAVVWLTACGGGGGGGSGSATPGGLGPSDPASLRNLAATRIPVATLNWDTCERTFPDDIQANLEEAPKRGFDCAVLQVPLDYLVPNGPSVEMAVRRRLADEPGERIGALIIEPGGPGGSGVDSVEEFADALSPQVRARFDIVGFDPRGVGRTRVSGLPKQPALPCSGDLARYFSEDLSSTHAGNASALDAAAKAYAATCKDNPIFAHMGTVNVVRDLEMLRRALGNAKLNYFGISYGTEVGILYADLYPTQLRTMILDGVVNPAQSGAEVLVQQAVSWQQGLEHFFDWCADQTRDEDCAIRSDPLGRFQAMRENAHQAPGTLEFDGARLPLSTGWVTLLPVLAIYNEHPAVYAHVARGIDAAAQVPPDWTILSRDASNSASAKTMGPTVWTTCLDQPLPAGDAFEAIVARAVAAAPLTGALSANIQRPCSHLPVAPDPVPTHYTATGTPPIMVWGTTGDPGTPWKSSAAVVAQLANASLFTFVANQHVAKGGGQARLDCVVEVQSQYLLSAQLVAQTRACGP